MKIGYWQWMVAPEEIETRCASEIEQLRDGHYKSLGLEKLSGCRSAVFSIRLNRGARLLLTPYNGILVAIAVLENHEYENHKYLDNKVLAQFLKNNGVEILAKVGTFKEDSGADIERIRDKGYQKCQAPTEWTSVEWQGEGWIALTKEQQAALNTLPLILKGPGGAGKSTVANALMLRHAMAFEDNRRILYLSNSGPLVRLMQLDFRSMSPDASQLIDDGRVRFSTFEDFVIQSFGIDRSSLVTTKTFDEWFNQFVKKNPYPCQDTSKTLPALELLWEEMKLCAGYENQEDYFALGRQSALPQHGGERSYVYGVYENYRKYLRSNNWVSLDLISSEQSMTPYDLVIVDEGQNCSPAQVLLAQKVTADNRLAFLIGEHQALTTERSVLPYIRWIFKQAHQAIQEISLPYTHRCPHAVIPFINELMRLSRNATGGLADKGEALVLKPVEQALQGEAVWITDLNEEVLASLNARKQHAGFAIIAEEEHHEFIRKFIPEGLLYTVEEAQGLGFNDLVVINPLKEGPVSQRLFEAVERRDATHRAKSGKEDFSLRDQFNKLITMMTRTQSRLTILQLEKGRWQTRLSGHLQKFFNDSAKEPATEHTTSVPSTLEEWKKKAQRLQVNGNEKQVKNIWEWYFNKIPFKQFLESLDLKETVPPFKGSPPKMPLQTGSGSPDNVANKKVHKNLPPIAVMSSVHQKKKKKRPKKGTESPTVSPAVAQSDLLLKKQKYLEDLVCKFFTPNIDTLLKKRSVIEYLLNIPFTKDSAEYLCFLHFIAEHSDHASLFIERFGELPLGNKVQLLAELITESTLHYRGDILTSILRLFFVPGVVNEKMLCCRATPLKDLSPMPLMYWIASFCVPRIHNELIKFFTDYHHQFGFNAAVIGQALSEPGLFTRETNYPVAPTKTSSAFCQFSHSQHGQSVLSTLFKLLRDLNQHVSVLALCGFSSTPCSLLASDYCPDLIKLPALYWLSISRNGLEILMSLLDNPLILEGITPTAFLAQRKCCNPKHGMLSTFGHLAVHHNDSPSAPHINDDKSSPNLEFQVLKRIIEGNSKVRGAISMQELRIRPSGSSTPSLGLSYPLGTIFLWLAEGGDLGQDILDLLLNGENISEITLEDLFNYGYCEPKKQPLMVFAALSGSEVGPSILMKILQNDALLKQITIESLRRPYYGLPVLLCLLTRGTEGDLSVFKKLLENPVIKEGIKAKDLCTLERDFFFKSITGTTALYWLALNKEGLGYVHEFMQNPTILKGINKEVLFTVLPSTYPMLGNTSLFLVLCKNAQGITILSEIFEKNPSLWCDFSTTALCVLRPMETTEFIANLSALYCLVYEPKGVGIDFLEKILSHQEILDTITAESVTVFRPIPGNQSVFACLGCSNDVKHRRILMRLLENPKILAGITSDNLFLPYLNHGSVFYSLANNGLDILSKLIENDALIAGLTGQMLIWSPPLQRGISALLFLSRSKEGCDILKTILDKKPSLKNQFHPNMLKNEVLGESIWGNLNKHGKSLYDCLERPTKQSFYSMLHQPVENHSPLGPSGQTKSPPFG